MISIPYPPVFRQLNDRRVATVTVAGGVGVEILVAPGHWHRVELTEDDACLLAASLLQKAGRYKLSRRVLRKLNKSAL